MKMIRLPRSLEAQLELILWLTLLVTLMAATYYPAESLSISIGVIIFTLAFRQIRLRITKSVNEGSGFGALYSGFIIRYILAGLLLAVAIYTQTASAVWILSGITICVAIMVTWSLLHLVWKKKIMHNGDAE
ncbi:ATP synthase subunit I [Desulfurispira natronophila]|uniref:Small-conductance mechanosensitive channel n=1 Tax=Desulfurispira natronophila TaxID=682562 RepID=A0A7W8DFU7_9BACT|nr:small-conductance mechanosensitive channel [Desulfurispira natronophila]